MKMSSFIKKTEKSGIKFDYRALVNLAIGAINAHRRLVLRSFCICVLLLIVSVVFVNKNINEVDLDNIDTIKFTEAPFAASASQRSVITIPSGTVKANPFVPYRDITETGVVNDVPTYSIVEPPEFVDNNSDAARIMDTVVSGILFDTFSPSAIINIEGNDYLVKKGDVVNNYKVLNITPDSVTVQLGKNSYKAGIGEILTSGAMNYNEVSNLNNKFGGGK